MVRVSCVRILGTPDSKMCQCSMSRLGIACDTTLALGK